MFVSGFRRALCCALISAATACDGGCSDQATPKPSGAKAAPAPTREVAAPRSPLRIPLAVGQWTLHRVRDDAGKESDLRYVVTGKESDAYWIGVSREGPGGKQQLQLLLKPAAASDASGSEILAIRLELPNGQLKELRGGLLTSNRQVYQEGIAALGLSKLAGKREDVRATAGLFRQAFMSKGVSSLSGKKVRSTLWSHPAVPVTALIRAEGDDGSVVELVDFGLQPKRGEASPSPPPSAEPAPSASAPPSASVSPP